MTVQEQELEREDSLWMAITGLTTHNDVFFDLVETSQESRLAYPNERLAFTFVVDNDVIQIEREVYNSFMLLGDVGGLHGFLTSLSAILVNIFTYKNAENWLVQSLFVKDVKDCSTDQED